MAKKAENGQQPGFFKEGGPVEEKEKEEKEKKPVDYESVGYDRGEVVSALIKDMRLGKVEDALYWIKVMRKANEPKNYVVRRLVAFAGEDAWGQEGFRIASDLVTTFNWEPPYDWNIVEQAAVMLTKCVKWWEVEDGIAWKKAEMKNQELLKIERLKKPVPHYALDEHTKRGWQLKDKGQMDNRMSGDGNGIAKRIDSFEKHGKFTWDDKGLRGWDRYVGEEFDRKTGHWRKEAKNGAVEPALVGGAALGESVAGPPEEEGPKRLASASNDADEDATRVEYDLESKRFRVQSDTDPDVFYTVDLIEGHCTCKHHEKRGAFCKHMERAKAWTPF